MESLLGKPFSSFLYLLAGLFTRSRRLCFLENSLNQFNIESTQNLPSLCFPSAENVDDKTDNNTHVGDESEGHHIIPSGGGKYSVDEVLVVAIFPNTRAAVQLSVTVTREALKIMITLRMVASGGGGGRGGGGGGRGLPHNR